MTDPVGHSQDRAPYSAVDLRWSHLGAVAITIWLGLESLRTFFAMVVWNIAEEQPAATIGAVALGIWTVGLLAWPVRRWFGGRLPVWRFGLLFTTVSVLNALTAQPVLTPVLGTAAAVAWMWFTPMLLVALGRGAASAVAAGILAGIAAQVALQHALHGMDLTMLRGIWPAAATAVLSVVLLYSVRDVTRDDANPDTALPGWGIAVLGPFLLLQMTLLANPGKIQMLAGWDARATAGLIWLGLAAGLVLLQWQRMSSAVAVIFGSAAILILARPAWLTTGGVWLTALSQVLLAPPLAAAFTVTTGRPARLYAAFAAAAVLLFGLTFLYYSRYGWPELWPLMAALVVGGAAAQGGRPNAGAAVRPALVAALLAAGLGIGVHIATTPRTANPVTLPRAQLTVMTYNLHMGFDARSVPNPDGLARVIEHSGADLVGLQEVGRGWTINGGVDLASWLAWRLPGYRLIYGPMNGDLWGNAVLSRLPIAASGSMRFPIRSSTFQRGLVWATVPTAAGEILFVSTHFSAFAPYAQERLAQAQDLLEFWDGRQPAIIVGDFNAPPDSPVIRRLLAAGLHDLTVPHGLGMAATYSALAPRERIDYIFASADVTSQAAGILMTTASDHLPVQATVVFR